MLLDAGASVNAIDRSLSDHRTPLHKAASQGHDAVVRLLLDRGADPSALDARGLDYLLLDCPADTDILSDLSSSSVPREILSTWEAIPNSKDDALSTQLPHGAALVSVSPPVATEICSRCNEPSITFAIVRKQLVCMVCKANPRPIVSTNSKSPSI